MATEEDVSVVSRADESLAASVFSGFKHVISNVIGNRGDVEEKLVETHEVEVEKPQQVDVEKHYQGVMVVGTHEEEDDELSAVEKSKDGVL